MLFVGYALGTEYTLRSTEQSAKSISLKDIPQIFGKTPQKTTTVSQPCSASLFCANSTKFTQKGEIMKLFFESYNGLVTLGATMNFGRRCNGCDG